MKDQALARKIAFFRQHYNCKEPAEQTSNAAQPGEVVDEELKEAFSALTPQPAQLPLYIKPADFIDPFGNILPDRVEPARTVSFEAANPRKYDLIKNYLKKRYPQRQAMAKQLASLAVQVDRAWRLRNRRREAEWGDPEDLGVPFSSIKSANSLAGGHVGHKSWKDALAEWVPEQEAVQVKRLLPSIFVVVNKDQQKSKKTTPIWSPEERKIFIEMYLQYPKNFARISAYLPYKSCEQCVQFYYLHKRQYRLKQMVVSYRRAIVAQRRLTLSVDISNTNSNNQQDEEQQTQTQTQQRRKVGRPKVRRE